MICVLLTTSIASPEPVERSRTRIIDFAHTACAEQGEDFVGTQLRSRSEGHGRFAFAEKIAQHTLKSQWGRDKVSWRSPVGGEPGSVDVFEIATPRLVASVDVGKQAGGIALWERER